MFRENLVTSKNYGSVCCIGSYLVNYLSKLYFRFIRCLCILYFWICDFRNNYSVLYTQSNVGGYVRYKILYMLFKRLLRCCVWYNCYLISGTTLLWLEKFLWKDPTILNCWILGESYLSYRGSNPLRHCQIAPAINNHLSNLRRWI